MRGIGTTGNKKEKEGHSQGARMKRVRVKCRGEWNGMSKEVDRMRTNQPQIHMLLP